VSEAVTAPPLPASGERLHPMGLLVGFVTGIPQLLFPMFAALFGTRDSGLGSMTIVGVVLVAALFFRWLSWLRFRFHLDDDDIRIERGLLNRTARSIPYDRIQDVSIEQKLLARLFNLGTVKFETGGGEGEDAKLSFVSMERAAALRETIRARKAKQSSLALPSTEVEEHQRVFAMDNRRLVTLGLYSFSLVIFAILGGAAQQLDFLLPFEVWDFKHWIGMAEDRGVIIDQISISARIIGGLLALGALILLGFASGIIRTFLKEYGFRLERTERGFRRQRGLLTRTDVVMPVNRVQAATIITGPFRQRRGWHALKFVSLAQDSKEESDLVAAPLAQLDEIWPIMAEAKLLPPGDSTSFERSASGYWFDRWLVSLLLILGSIFVAGAITSIFAWWALAVPILLGIYHWLEWKQTLHAIDLRQLFARAGWWRRRLDIARQINVQSVTISQGPLTRRRGLANLEFGIAGGTLVFTALPLEMARDIRDQVLRVVAPVDFSELNRAV
jgi:putative membrane protein